MQHEQFVGSSKGNTSIVFYFEEKDEFLESLVPGLIGEKFVGRSQFI